MGIISDTYKGYYYLRSLCQNTITIVVAIRDIRAIDSTSPSTRPSWTSAIMARLRRDTQESASPAIQRPLRVVASGTLFLTHTLSLPTHPEPSSVVRARSVTRSRGGSASTCLAILAQFPSVEAMLVAPLGGNDDGRMIIRDLEKERVSTRFCKIWNDAGVPSAWVLDAGKFPFMTSGV